jgi:hypothetical protein
LNRKKLQDAGADTTDIRELTAGDYTDFFKKLEENMHVARMLEKKEEVVREERRLKVGATNLGFDTNSVSTQRIYFILPIAP